MITVDERFDSKVDRSAGPDACWLWTGGKAGKGYGYFWVSGRCVYAHRFSLARALGRELVLGEHALHTCDRPPCVNPDHLRAGSNADNVADMVAKGRHSYGEANPMAKLTAFDAAQIRAAHAAGGVLQRDLADRFGVSRRTVGMIINGTRWRHA